MDRLSLLLSMLTGSTVAGALVILALASGWYGWMPIIAAIIIGAIVAWPLGLAISRRIKRNDPHFDHRRNRRIGERDGAPRHPKAHEV